MRNKKWIYLIIILLIAAGVAGGFILYSIQNRKESDRKFIEDARAKNGIIKDGVDEERLKEAIQNETDKSKFQFGINSKVEFTDCFSKGAFCIENPSTNLFQVQVTITRNDTKETVYKTAAIKPGYGVESGKLLVQLGKGTYGCTATLTAQVKKEKVGQVEVPVTIIIQN